MRYWKRNVRILIDTTLIELECYIESSWTIIKYAVRNSDK
jgi:hypothetical protein